MANFLLIAFIVLQLILVFWAWYDLSQNKKINLGLKFMAALAVFLFPVLGPIVYFHLKYQQIKKRKFLQPV